jgi:hypothetical protein
MMNAGNRRRWLCARRGRRKRQVVGKVVGSWKREMVDNLLTGNVEIPDDKLQVVFVGKL